MNQIKVFHNNVLIANTPTMFNKPVAVPYDIWTEFKKMLFLDRASIGSFGPWKFIKEPA